jgi:hypothetical protein
MNRTTRIIVAMLALMAIAIPAFAITQTQTDLKLAVYNKRDNASLGHPPMADCLASIAQTHADYIYNNFQTSQISNLINKIHNSCGTPLGTFSADSVSKYNYEDNTPAQCVNTLYNLDVGVILYYPADSMGTGASHFNDSAFDQACVVIMKNND